MAKIVVAEFLSLDGIMGEPQTWSFPYWGDDIAKFKFDELFASGAHLLGRVTYDGFAAACIGNFVVQLGFAGLSEFGHNKNRIRKALFGN